MPQYLFAISSFSATVGLGSKLLLIGFHRQSDFLIDQFGLQHTERASFFCAPLKVSKKKRGD